MNVLKRIKRAWQLSQKRPELLESITDEEIKALPNEGDGKAEFLGSGTIEEWEELKREDAGMKAWYERLKNL